MNFYQACFTRIGSQGLNDGWQTLNNSENIPSNALSNFTRFQNGNILQSNADITNLPNQNILELQSDNNFIYLTKINYAIKDRNGRPSMFAHGYIFDANDFAKNPNFVLNVDKSNFNFNPADTEIIPKNLILTDKNDTKLSDAIKNCYMNQETFETLILCIYFMTESKTKSSIHVKCDCSDDITDEFIRNFMYCIYSSIPFSMRKKISFSIGEIPNSSVKTIIFDKEIKNDCKYFIPNTNKNNILNETQKKRWENYNFIKYIFQNFNNTNTEKYFEQLEQKAMLFGNSQSISMDIYKISHELLFENDNKRKIELSDEDYCKRLNEYLSIQLNQYTYLDNLLSDLLYEILEQKILLNEILTEKLYKKFEKTESNALIEAGYMFNAVKIQKMQQNDGAKLLYNNYYNHNPITFSNISNILSANKKGLAIIKTFFDEFIMINEKIDKEYILNFYEQTKDLNKVDYIKTYLNELSQKFARNLLKNENPTNIINKMLKLLNIIFKNDQNLIDLCINEIKLNFWNNFEFENIVLNSEFYYDLIKIDENPIYISVINLQNIWSYFENGKKTLFIKNIQEKFDIKSSEFDLSTKKILIKKFQDSCLLKKDIYDINELDIWIILANLNTKQENPIQFLAKNNITSFVLNFETTLNDSEILKESEIRINFIENMQLYIKNKSNNYKIVLKNLKILNEINKKEQKDDDKSKNFLVKLKNKFK